MLERFLSLVESDPSAPALIDAQDGAVTSRRALLSQSEELADRLTGAGMRARQAAAIQLPNSVEFVATVIAAFRRGLIVVPIDRDAPATEVASLLSHFAVRGLIHRGSRSGASLAIRDDRDGPAVPDDACLLKLTSGSTGLPHGIVTTEANLIADCENICSTMGIGGADVNLGAIPFSHSYGFSNLVMPLLLKGTPVVFSNDYLPQSLLDHANRWKCTVAPLIPMVFTHLTSVAVAAFTTVETFISAGAPLPAATSRRFRERFGRDIHSFYGCSECGGITYDRRGGAVERGTVGSAMDGVELHLLGTRVAVRSGAVAAGSLLDARTFRPFAGGTFTTDDLVEEREGELALIGRASDLINIAGKKVNPREVEAVILQIDGVHEARVYGEPAGARGEIVAAAVVALPEITRDQIRDHCRRQLSLHKVPRIVKLLEELPVDERGKVKKTALAEL